MTTIAYRNGVMAGDSQSTILEGAMGRVIKVWVCQGHLMGMTGAMQPIEKFRRWVSAQDLAAVLSAGEFPDFIKDADQGDTVTGYIVTPRRLIYRFENRGAAWRVRAPFIACGSGRDYAMGALVMGASPEQAVRAAARFDINSGGPVQVVRL